MPDATTVSYARGPKQRFTVGALLQALKPYVPGIISATFILMQIPDRALITDRQNKAL
jgi:uncharacterized membrane protein YqaE (UPF0057 family)